ncbi:hypothetical protein DACRYDRAFT_78142 [Dacryopinax primogenitus]|uniref:Sensitive to high expression protein 9, mitochondrial n=1 Tax=Dacryopinax primogenitus (strain DJM 731) TaxID=1858805 RepID=M5G4U2_DACPD|nr:uncharacterized protein DACRYDRAFT_78142 [Dacryopinax primogenitus]EJU03240.1 hypothetical protein DACRYDRAFT_78142 [Dacryopinax primogenitus]
MRTVRYCLGRGILLEARLEGRLQLTRRYTDSASPRQATTLSSASSSASSSSTSPSTSTTTPTSTTASILLPPPSSPSPSPSSSPLTTPATPTSPPPTPPSPSIQIHRRLNTLFQDASARLSTFGERLNQFTGYAEIEGLKKQEGMHLLHQDARNAKREYELAVSARSACQRQVNDLLQRKSMWTESDVSRFTELVRQDHANEQTEQVAQEGVQKAEEEVERGQGVLMQTILHRYHEEQVWSDKIRSASTYGSLVALGLNMVVFMMAVVVVEPWKRKRLAEVFELRVGEMTREVEGVVREEVGKVGKRLERDERGLEVPRAGVPPVLVQTRTASVQTDITLEEPHEPRERAPWIERDWKSTIVRTWSAIRSRGMEDDQVVLALASTAVGVLGMGMVSLSVWAMRNR